MVRSILATVMISLAFLMVLQAVDSGAGPDTTVRIGTLASRAEAAGFSLVSASPAHRELSSAPVQPPVPRAQIPLGRESIHVPILMYHYIRVNPVPGDQLGANLSVTPQDFERQMDWLAANGYHPVDLADVRAYFAGRAPLPAKPVVLTFDDGYRDMYTTAYPILRAHHFKAVSYVVTGFVGGPNYMSWDMIRELDANGIEIGAHTYSHADLTTVSPDELHLQLADSESTLAAQLWHPVVDFCYPAGRFNDTVVAAVQAAGYQTATTTEPGTVHSPGDRYTWTRVRVSGGEDLGQFIANLGPAEPTVAAAPEPGYVRSPGLPQGPLVYAYAPPLPLPPLLADPRLLP